MKSLDVTKELTLEQALADREVFLQKHPYLKEYQELIDLETSKVKSLKQKLIALTNISAKMRTDRKLPNIMQ